MSKKSATSAKVIGTFLAGTVIAAVGIGYGVKDDSGQPLIESLLQNPEPQETVEKSEEQATENTTEKPQEPVAEANSNQAQEEVIASLPQTEPAAPEITTDESPAINEAPLPSFDILRVERDGSVVVAGRAAPESLVEIIENSVVLGKTESGKTGEFVVIFETPLSTGDHALTIRATPKDGEAVLSAEAGIVTIPEKSDAKGEVLAMVQKPGAATRLLQVPEEEPDVEDKTPEPVPSANQAQETETVQEVAKPEPEPKAEETQVAALDTTTEPKPEIKKTEIKKPDVKNMTAEPLLVQAVDVEPNRLFIAGKGQAGRTIRFYIDGDYKGSASVNAGGTFLLELNEGLKPGKHNLRADMINGSNGEVTSRTALVIDHAPELVEVAKAPKTKKAPKVEESSEPEQQIASANEPNTQEPVVQEAETPEAKASTTDTVSVAEAPKQEEQKTSVVETQAQPQQDEVVTNPAPKGVEEIQKEETADTTIAAAESETSSATTKSETSSDAETLPVLKTGRSVIIRHGDNLWRISRRMLGAGHKYTLIFSANANQISDPNRIYPGQVFDVPDADEEQTENGVTKKSG